MYQATEKVSFVIITRRKLTKGRDDSENTTGFGRVKSSSTRSEETTSQQGKSEGKETEKEDESDGRSERSHKEQESENHPADQVKTQSRVELISGILAGVCVSNTESWSQDGSKGHPETSIGRESSSTKGISAGKLPHTSEKLNSTTVEKGKTNNDIVDGDTASTGVDEG